jgi:coenzyme F420-reducing hydrogenase delta subunit
MENAARDGYAYDADSAVVPVKCTGLVKVSMLLKLFAKGMDGVLVLGCDEEDCRYFNGSRRCGEIVEETREILDISGIDRKRLGYFMIPEAGGKEFRKVMDAFLTQLGGKAKRRKRVAGSRNK